MRIALLVIIALFLHSRPLFADTKAVKQDQALSVSITPIKTIQANTCAYGYSANLVIGFPQSPNKIRFEAVAKGAGALTYSWKGTYIDALSNPFVLNPEFDPLKANNPHPPCATYSYTVTVTDAQKNTATASVSVNVVCLAVEGCGNGKVIVCHKNSAGIGSEVCTSAMSIPGHASDHGAFPAGHANCCLGSCGNKCFSSTRIGASSLMDEDLESGTVLENFPEPFKINTTIRFIVPENMPVTLDVYDLSGKLIKTLFKEMAQGEREYKILFEPGDLSQGIYIYKLITPAETFQGKMVLMAK